MRRISIIALACALAPAAQAQNYQRVVSFGDSLADSGNLFSIARQPPSPPYNQRFTNGFTYAEYLAGGGGSQLGFLSGRTGPGSVNYAFGGARNDSNSNTNDVAGSGFTIPSTIAQIGAFRQRGGSFGANDVVTYWAGANNLFQSTAAAAASPATAQAVVQADAIAAGVAVGAQVGQLAALGARTVVVSNLPDFGSLPAYTSLGAQGVALGSFASFTYNNASGAALQAAAAANPGANIVQIDVAGAFADVIARPSAYGFANVAAPCVTTPSCVTASRAAQNQFLFWDTVHPTDAGHQLLASVVGEYLYAPGRTAGVSVLGEVGLWSRRSTTLDMLDKARGADPKGEQVQYFVAVAGEHAERDQNFSGQQSIGGASLATSLTSKYTQGGLRIGGFKGFGNGWTGGFAVSALTGDASSGAVSASPTSISADISAGWRQGAAFATAQAGAGFDRFSDYSRKTTIAALTQKASTDGVSASGSLEGGYDIGFGALSLTPVGRLTYLYTNVAGFDEQAPYASVRFAARTLQGLTGAVELRGKAKLSDAAALTALVGYENYIAKSFASVRGSFINNTALPFASAGGRPVGAGLIFGAGAEARLGTWTAGLNYRGSLGERSQMTHKAELRIGSVW